MLEYIKGKLAEANIEAEAVVVITTGLQEKFDAIVQSKTKEITDVKAELEKQVIELNVELGKLKASTNSDEDMKIKIGELQDNLAKKDKEIEKIIFDNRLEVALNTHKVRNSKAIKALLNFDDITLQDKELKGLEEQIKTLKESDSYLFAEEGNENPDMGGAGNFKRKLKSPTNNPWKRETLNLTEQAKLLKENPILAKQLMEESRK